LAHGCDLLVDQVPDGLVRIPHVRLLQEAHFLEELLQAAFDDLVDHVLRLAFVKRPGALHLPLALDHRLGNIGAVHVLRLHGRDLHRDLPDQLPEFLGLRDEVGLAVDLDEHADAPVTVDVGVDDALRGDAGRLLGRLRQALLPEVVDGLLHVATGGLEGALAVHHARLRPLAELFYHLARDLCHVEPPSWSWMRERRARRGIAHLCGRLAHTLSTPRLRLDGSGDRLFIPGAPELLLARHLIRLVPGLGLLQALLALEDGVSQLAREKAHRPDRIVVARDDEVDLVRIAVGIDDGDDGDAQLPRFGDSDPLFAGVDDKDGIRQLLHNADAAHKAVEPL